MRRGCRTLSPAPCRPLTDPMHWPLLVANLVSSVILAVWTQRAVAAQRCLPRIPRLLDARYDPVPARSVEDRAQITVIVPARNESAAIEATLRSLLAQTIPLEILAVDDRSTDATGALMDRIAAEPMPRGKVLSVIHINSLPPGWMGKNHAMALAARQTGTRGCSLPTATFFSSRRRSSAHCALPSKTAPTTSSCSPR